MDATDVKLLGILSKNARITAAEITKQVDLSIPAINKRISKMQRTGLITGFTAIVDPEKAGKPITTFVLINLQNISAADKLLEYVDSDPDVLECYSVTGEYDYILKICAQDVKTLEKKLKLLKQQKGVVKSHTLFSLRECKFCPTILPERKEKKKDE